MEEHDVMKKAIGSIILAFLISVTVCFAADISVDVKLGDTQIADGASISLADAKTKTLSVSGTYNSGARVSMEVRNTDTGLNVLSQQGECDASGAYSIGAIMSDDAVAGQYVLTVGASGLESAKTYKFTLTDAVKPTAQIVIGVTGGKASISKDGNVIATNVTMETAAYEIGTKLTLKAEPDDDNKTFLYWQNKNSKVIISTLETVDITVGSNGEYAAVYADKAAAYVTFKSNGMLIAAGSGIAVPNDPYIAGYTFAGWYAGDVKTDLRAGEAVNVSENTTYLAGYNLNDVKYTVKAEGAESAVDGSYSYNEKINVAPAAKDGMVFTHWSRTDKDGANEIIVSYNERYSFFVDGDTYIKANYATAALDKQIVLVMSNPVMADATRVAFYAERDIPENYTVIENGILISSQADFDLSTNGIIVAKSRSKALKGKYTVRKANASAGETWYAKAYLIYSDGTNVYTVYSNQVSKTVE